MMTSQIVSPMSYRSPSINVIGSPSNLEALVFFRGPMCSGTRSCFNYVKVVLGSVPSVVAPVPYSAIMSGRLSSCVIVAPPTVVFSVGHSLPPGTPALPQRVVHSASVGLAAWQ